MEQHPISTEQEQQCPHISVRGCHFSGTYRALSIIRFGTCNIVCGWTLIDNDLVMIERHRRHPLQSTMIAITCTSTPFIVVFTLTDYIYFTSTCLQNYGLHSMMDHLWHLVCYINKSGATQGTYVGPRLTGSRRVTKYCASG
jgi:hypothetical protein